MALTKISTAMWNSVPHHDTHDFNVDDVLYVDVSANRVGIGEPTPDYPLHISSTLGFPVIIERTNAADAGIRFKDSTTTDADQVRLGARGNDLQILTGGSESVRINSSGSLLLKGTGTTSLLKFDSSSYGQITSTGNTLYYDVDTQIFRSSSAAERMKIHSGGDISFRDTSSNEAFYWDASTASLGIGTGSTITGKFNSYISATRQLTHNGNGGDLSIISDNNSTPVMYIKGTGTADLLQVFDNTSQIFTIKDGGNIGIGVTSPINVLQVSGNLNADNSAIWLGGGYVANSLYHYADAPVGISGRWGSSGDNGAGITLMSRNTGNSNWYHGYVSLKRDGNFYIGMDGLGTAPASDQVTLLRNGNLGIGSTNPSAKLHVETTSSSGTEDIAVFSRPTYGEVFKITREAGEAVLNANSNLTLSADYNNTFTGTGSNIIFKQDATERMRINSAGNVIATVDMRAPIFYDSNDTNYYVDPNANSKLKYIASGDAGVLASGYGITSYDSKRYLIGFRNSSATGTNYPWLVHDDISGGDGLIVHFNGVGDRMTLNELGSLTATGDMRAPIFYDSNNTAWYTNPAGRSLLDTLQLGGDSSDTTNLKLDVQGNMAIRGGNGLYYGVSTNNYNSWTTRMYASGSTQYFNAQEFRFDNQGYGSKTFGIINTSGIQGEVFYDINNTGYYVDPASTSNLNTLRTYGPIISGDSYTDPDIVFAIYEYDTTDTIRDKFKANSNFTRVDDSTAPALGCFQVSGPNNQDTFTPYYKIDEGQEYVFEFWVKWVSGTDADSRLYVGSRFYDSSKNYLGNSQRYWGQSGTQVDSNSNNSGWYHVSGTLGPTRGGNTGQIPTAAEWMRLLVLFNYSGGDTVTRFCGFKVYKSNKTITSLYRKELNTQFGSSENKVVVIDNSGNMHAPIFYDSNDTSYYINPNGGSVLKGTVTLHDNGAGSPLLDIRSDDAGPWAIRLYRDDLSTGPQVYASDANTWYFNHTVYAGQSIRAGGDARAPIFYDSADTNYYTDPPGLTYVNAITATRIGVNPSGSSSSKYGISLYGGYSSGEPTYGLLFTGTSGLGTHGAVTSDWATYFTMNNSTTRGWIFRRVGAANVASISGGGTAHFNGDVVAYSSSDERLKDNKKNIENALEKVESLNGIEFDWNDKQDIYTGHDIGVIAQEVEKIAPEVVADREDGYKAVKYEKLAPLLIEAIKELSEKVKILENK